MTYIVSASLLLAGIIHILPITGVFGQGSLASLYGVRIDDPNLLVLMRHRAVLFAILGVLLIVSAFRSQYQLLAIAAALVSTISFLWIAWSTGGYNAQIARVVLADIVAIVALLVALGARFAGSPS